MSLVLLFAAFWFGLVSAWTAPPFELEHAELHFERFIRQYDRQYADEHEKQARFRIFIDNLEKANSMNEQSDHAVFGITQFMDLTSEEFIDTYTGFNMLSNLTMHSCADVTDSQIPDSSAPESLDWRSYGFVSRVKNQLRCGSCYAFSATGHIESQYAIKYKKQIEVSEQQIVDCDTVSNGCNGGYPSAAFSYIIQQGGIVSEQSYPYLDAHSACRFDQTQVAVRLTSCYSYRLQSQEKLKQLLYRVGPLSIAVKAAAFHKYNGGILSDASCNVGPVNHAVLLVGYGTENGQPYWIIKNSWGDRFGERGYIRIARGEGFDSCGILNADMASAVIQ